MSEFDDALDLFEKAVQRVESNYPEDVFPESGTSSDCQSASMARQTCRNVRYELARLIQDMFDSAPRGHIPPPVDVPYLAVGTVLQPLPKPQPNISSSDSRTSSDASPEAAPRPTD